MSPNRQWLDAALDDLPSERAQRIRLFRSLLMAAARLRGRLDRSLAPSGITAQQGALMQFVESQDSPPTLTQVARAMAMTHQNAKQIAAALARKGFVEIAVDADDRRVRRLIPTRRHRRFWAERNADDFAAVERWTAGLSDAEVTTLLGLLARLQEPLRDDDEAGTAPS